MQAGRGHHTTSFVRALACACACVCVRACLRVCLRVCPCVRVCEGKGGRVARFWVASDTHLGGINKIVIYPPENRTTHQRIATNCTNRERGECEYVRV